MKRSVNHKWEKIKKLLGDPAKTKIKENNKNT